MVQVEFFERSKWKCEACGILITQLPGPEIPAPLTDHDLAFFEEFAKGFKHSEVVALARQLIGERREDRKRLEELRAVEAEARELDELFCGHLEDSDAHRLHLALAKVSS